MLGLSLSKLLVTALVLLAVWYGYRWWTRVESHRRADLDARMRDEIAENTRRNRERRDASNADELVRCSVCGTYVAATATAPCSRGDCPYRR